MQLTHTPDHVQSKRLKELTRDNLISSLKYVLYVCDDVLDKNTYFKVEEFISLAESKKYSSGFLFYAVKEICKGIERQELDRIKNCFSLIAKLELDKNEKVIIGRKDNLPEGVFDFFSKTNDDVYSFQYIDVMVEYDDLIKIGLDEAFSLILDVDPELYLEIQEIVDEFFVFSANENNGHIVYSGSDFNKLGTVFINKEACVKDLYFLVDKIIHESAHQVLLSIMTVDEIVLNQDNERFPSPLRTGLRTMNGIYHAAFVLYRIACFFSRVLKLNPSDSKAFYHFNISVEQFKGCYDVITSHGHLTPLGNTFIKNCNAEIEAVLDEVH